MSTRVQWRRGNTAQTAVFTGAVGEITVDTDKNIVVVHDGVTAGGHKGSTLVYTQASFDRANAGYNEANTAHAIAQGAFDSANNVAPQIEPAFTRANSAYAQANAGYSQANSAYVYVTAVDTYAQSGHAKANSANVLAQAAYNNANTKFASAGGTITGDVTITGQANVHSRLAVGEGSFAILPNLIAQFTGTSDYYSQINQQNLSGLGSGDIVVTANNGTDAVNYTDMGMAGGDYDNTTFNAFPMVQPNDGYLMVVGNPSQMYGGNLYVGTAGSGAYADISFIQGDNFGESARLVHEQGLVIKTGVESTSNGSGALVVVGGIGANGSIRGDAIYDSGVRITTYVNTANSFLQANDATTLAAAKSYTDTANTNLKSYVDTGLSTTLSTAEGYTDTANTKMKSYVDTGLSTTLSTAEGYTDTANTKLKSYVDTGLSTTLSTAEGYTDTANTNLKSYVDTGLASAQSYTNTANTNLKSYVDTGLATTLSTAESYTDTANTNLKSYVDTGLATAQSYTNTANTNLKSYVDTGLSTTLATSEGYTDTANTKMKSYVDTTLVTAEGYTDTANTKMKSYVDTGLSTTLSTSQAYTDTANGIIQGQITNLNTYSSAGFGIANASYSQANAAYDHANSAFVVANTKFDSVGGTISGDVTISGNNDLTITGNLHVYGNTITTDIQTLSVANSIIYLAKDQPGNTVDTGIVSSFTNGHYQHTGMARNHLTGVWGFFSNVTSEPTTSINWDEAGILYDTIRVGNIITPIATVNGIEIGAYSSAAYASQNITAGFANAAYTQANTNAGAITVIQGVDATQNANITTVTNNAIAAYLQANTGTTLAQNAYNAANTNASGITVIQGVDNTQNTNITTVTNNAVAAYLQANTGTTLAQNAYAAANTNASAITVIQGVDATQNTNITTVTNNAIAAYLQANTATTTAGFAYTQANSSTTLAQSAFNKANTVTGITYTAANTTPVSPHNGDQWYYIATDVLYEYITDGTSSYWVDVTGPVVTSSPATVTDTLSPFLLMGA